MVAPSSLLPDLNKLNARALRELIQSQHEQLDSHYQRLLSQDEQLQAQEQQLQQQREQLEWREAQIQHLQLLIAKLQRRQFGRKSEKLDRQIEQLQLQLEELQTTAEPEALLDSPVVDESGATSEAEATPAVPNAGGKARSTRTRKPLPAHLPRERHVHEPESSSCACGQPMTKMGEEVTETLEFVPGYFKVLEGCISAVCLRRMQQAGASPGAEPADRAGAGGSGTAGACAGFQVR